MMKVYVPFGIRTSVRFSVIALLFTLLLVSACNDDSDDTYYSTDGDVQDGDTEDGDTQDGDTQDGDTEDGDTEDGDTQDGDATDGDIIDGDANVALNEVDCNGRDWLEIINLSDTEANITGWLVADNLSEANHQYQIPMGIIPPNGYLVIKEETDQEAGFPFGFKCGIDTAYLVAPGGIVIDSTQTGEIPEGSTWGRLPDGTGQWQETLSTQGEYNQLPATNAASLFLPTQINEIAITLSDDAIAKLDLSPYDYVEGEFTVEFGGGAIGPISVGVRLKSGDSFKPLSEKAAFKISFDKFAQGQRLFGLKGLTLNNMVQDPTMLKETLAYYLYSAFDVPSPRTGYANVTVNGEEYGLYLVLEKYDRSFADRWFTTTDHIYEGADVDLDSGNAGRFEVDTGSDSDIADLVAFINAINASNDATWYTSLSEIADLQEIIRMWVVENYIGQTDGYTIAANNYYLHSDKAGLFSMLPWGSDRTFNDQIELPGGESVMAARCFSIDACTQQYEFLLSQLLPIVDSLNLADYVDTIAAAIESDVDNDPRKPSSSEEFTAGIEDLKSYLELRRQTAERLQ